MCQFKMCSCKVNEYLVLLYIYSVLINVTYRWYSSYMIIVKYINRWAYDCKQESDMQPICSKSSYCQNNRNLVDSSISLKCPNNTGVHS